MDLTDCGKEFQAIADWDLENQTPNRTMFDVCERLVPALCCCCP